MKGQSLSLLIRIISAKRDKRRYLSVSASVVGSYNQTIAKQHDKLTLDYLDLVWALVIP